MKSTYSPLFICSKKRPMAKLFQLTAGHDVTVFVEKEDVASYRANPALKNATIVTLKESGRGLAFARQSALEWARQKSTKFYWMLDDDISGFFRTAKGKEENVGRKIGPLLLSAERRLATEPLLGVGALEYRQFAWNSRPGHVTRGGYADCCVLINSSVPANYRLILPLKVDRDFTLSVLSCGYDVVRLRDLSFSVPANGSNKGGLHDDYAKGIEATASRMMERLWPGIAEAHTKPDGRPDVRIHWKRLMAAR